MSYKYTHDERRDRRHKFAAILIGLVMVFAGGLAAAHGSNHSPTRQIIPVVAAQKPAVSLTVNTNYSLPIRLQIPKLQLDTRVLNVGLTKDGSMNMPSSMTEAGWYKYGALPGNTGTAVIGGHLYGFHGIPGVFSKLNKLVPGDTITVTESNGLAVSFVVRETRSYPQTDRPAEVFNSPSGSHLNLITCAGAWDSQEQRFAQRFVVFADKAS